MATQRVDTQKRFPVKNAEGQRQCRECGRSPLPTGRRSWCSDACVDAYLARAQPSFLRTKVRYRDKGVCAICHLDTYALIKAIVNYGGRNSDRSNKMTRLIQRLWKRRISGSKTLWDMDHIVPIAEGGENQLANLQTLCCRCHHKKTVAQAARRRKSKKIAQI